MPDRPDPPHTSQSGGSDDLPSSHRPDPIAALFSEAIEGCEIYIPRYGSVETHLRRELGATPVSDKLWTVLDRSAWNDEVLLRISDTRKALGQDGAALVAHTSPETMQVNNEIATWLAIVDPQYDSTVLAPRLLEGASNSSQSIATGDPQDGFGVEVLRSDTRFPVAALVIFAEPNLIEGTFTVRAEHRFTRDALPALGENLMLALRTGHGDSLLLREIQRQRAAEQRQWLEKLVANEFSQELYGNDGDERREIDRLKLRGAHRPLDKGSETPQERIARYERELNSAGWTSIVGMLGKPLMNSRDELTFTIRVNKLPSHPIKAKDEQPRIQLARFRVTLDGPEFGRLRVTAPEQSAPD